jgi:hypothetical protein
MKTGWLKLSGTVDYFLSGFSTGPLSAIMPSAFFGSMVGIALGLLLPEYGAAQSQSFSDDADRDVELFDGGALMSFPKSCVLGSGFYLISQKKGGGLEIGRGSHSYAHVLPIEAQEKITDDISDCMDDMSGWVKKGRFNFLRQESF